MIFLTPHGSKCELRLNVHRQLITPGVQTSVEAFWEQSSAASLARSNVRKSLLSKHYFIAIVQLTLPFTSAAKPMPPADRTMNTQYTVAALPVQR